MILQIKDTLTFDEINYLLQIINKTDKFSYEFAHVLHSFDFIEFLVNNPNFLCILFYDNYTFNLNIRNIKGFMLGHTSLMYSQTSQNKLRLTVTKKNDYKEFDYAHIFFVDYFNIVSNENKYTFFEKIQHNLNITLNELHLESCIFKLNSEINDKNLIKKYYNFRPINLDLLSKIGILNNNYVKDPINKVYNTFTYPMTFNKHKIIQMNPNKDDVDLNSLFYSLIEYNLQNYEMCSNITFDELEEIFENDIFYKFLVYDKDTGILTDFVCFVKNTCSNSSMDLYCKNVHFYFGIFLSDNVQYKYDILEYICYYACTNQLFDMMTILDDINKPKISTKFLKTIKKDYYYNTNLNLSNSVYLNI